MPSQGMSASCQHLHRLLTAQRPALRAASAPHPLSCRVAAVRPPMPDSLSAFLDDLDRCEHKIICRFDEARSRLVR